MGGLSVADILQTAGVVGILALIVVTGARRQWVWFTVVQDERAVAKERLDEVRKDRDEWKGLAQNATASNLTLTQQNEKMAGVVENLTAIVRDRLPDHAR